MQDEKTLEFLDKLKSIGHFNNNCDYSKVIYKTNHDKVLVIDKDLNSEHLLSPMKMISRNVKCGIRNSMIIFFTYNIYIFSCFNCIYE